MSKYAVTWTTHRILRAVEPFEMPERIHTRHGNILVRVPDKLRVNGRLFWSARYYTKLRKKIARDMTQRIDEMARAALFGAGFC